MQRAGAFGSQTQFPGFCLDVDHTSTDFGGQCLCQHTPGALAFLVIMRRYVLVASRRDTPSPPSSFEHPHPSLEHPTTNTTTTTKCLCRHTHLELLRFSSSGTARLGALGLGSLGAFLALSWSLQHSTAQHGTACGYQHSMAQHESLSTSCFLCPGHGLLGALLGLVTAHSTAWDSMAQHGMA
jgi:hypothetical protein